MKNARRVKQFSPALLPLTSDALLSPHHKYFSSSIKHDDDTQPFDAVCVKREDSHV